MPALARCLTLFQYVQAVTEGPVARIDQAGCYSVPTLRGEAFSVRPGGVALRLDGEAVDSAVLVQDESGGGAVELRLLDQGGRTVHRGRLLSEGDRLLAGLVEGVGSAAGVSNGLPEVPGWEDGDQLAQFDAVLRDGGVERRVGFPRYRGECREVDAGVVPAVFDHLCSVELPIGIGVFAPGVMQACAGPVHVTDVTSGGRLFAAVGQGSVEFDLTGVHTCRLVRSSAAHGPTSALELDDREGRCVAVITQFGIVGEAVHEAWEHLAASLPGS
ncbi:hypothetical protein ABZX85_37830 [Streptomyces sp. NPDC004539]|uniref:hypothetical protein n=1 Tax=Streptomyces sp. NPDC004539 TaxID=3154280 RepID=UPI0033B2A999